MLSKEWIGGFISGEGCFTFNGITPTFSITLSKKDKDILYDIQKSISVGRINNGINSSININNINNCLPFIEFIDGSIRGDKKIDYDNWKLGIKFIQSFTGYSSEEDREFIYSLKPRQNKERKVFTEDDIPKHIKNKRKCKDCNVEFELEGSDTCSLRCEKCNKIYKRKYIREYMREYFRNNPEQRKKNIEYAKKNQYKRYHNL